MLTTAVPDSGV